MASAAYEKNKASIRKYYLKNRERLLAVAKEKSRVRRAEQPDKVRNEKLRGHYGISLLQYSDLLAAQHGVCAVCHEPETETRHGKVRQMCVDHNHTTGQIRGLICSHCNLAIGYLHDSPARALAIASYLERTDG